MGKTGKLVVLGLLALALAGGAAWWLLHERSEGLSELRAAESSTPAASAAASADALDTAQLPRPSDAAPAAIVPAAGAIAADAAAPRPGLAVTFTGRVVDPDGRPVAGAAVTHVPTWATTGATPELAWSSNGSKPHWELFDRATTDAQGRFSLPSRELADSGAPLVDFSRAGGGTTHSFEGRLPRLLVEHPAFEPTVFYDLGWPHGGVALGDLVVRPGAVVVGRLVDEQDRPVAGGLVQLYWQAMPEPYPSAWELLKDRPHAGSAADGRFTLDGLWGVALSLDISAEGRVPLHRRVVLQPGHTEDLGDVVLLPGEAVAGWVQDERGAPIAGADVILHTFSGSPATDPDAAWIESVTRTYGEGVYELRTRTDAGGAFRLTGVRKPKGGVRVLVQAEGYEPALLADVAPGKDDLRLTLKRAATLRLVVHAAGSSDAVPELKITAWRPLQSSAYGEMSAPLPARVDGAAFVISGVGPAGGKAVLSAPGHASTDVALQGVPPGETREQSVELPAEVVLAGHVVDESGAAVPRAAVAIERPEDEYSQHTVRATADASGAFTAHALAAGDWNVTATAAGFVPAPPQPVTLAAGQPAADLRLVLVRGARLEGHLRARNPAQTVGQMIRAEAGLPAAGWADQRRFDFKTLSDDEGAYVLDGLPPGDYRVITADCDPVPTNVAVGQVTTVDLVLRGKPRLTGRVTAGGAPVEGAEVVVNDVIGALRESFESQLVKTDSSGRYAVTLEDTMTIEVYARHAGTRTRAEAVKPQWDDDATLDLAFSDLAVQGVAVDVGGAPLADVQVLFTLEARAAATDTDRILSSAKTDAQGRFRCGGLPSGDGTLTAGRDGYATATLKGVPVAEGAPPLRVELRAGGTLEVHVTASAEPRHLRFTLTSQVDPEWKRSLDLDSGATKQVPDVPAGEVAVEIERQPAPDKPWEPLHDTNVTIVAGQVTHLEQSPDG